MTTVPAADSPGEQPGPGGAETSTGPAGPAIPAQPAGDAEPLPAGSPRASAPPAGGAVAAAPPDAAPPPVTWATPAAVAPLATAVLAPPAATAPGSPAPTGWRTWPTRLARGRPGDPRWARPALLALLALTAVLYLWDLGASGYANSFYAAAVQAGTISWRALFFGSLDASSFITVDKPPASLWLMALSGRVFGFSSWSMLVPEALCGVAAVGLLHATVRRTAGPTAGLLAALVCALTPVAALMFRFNNPDALLVLTMVLGAYCVVRAAQSGSWLWITLAGVAIGFGFLTKMLQAFLVLPAFALAYLVAAPPRLPRRVGQVLAGGAGVVVGAGWWLAAVALTPASSRPYVGGSENNSELGLAFGYNGLGRIFGGEGNRGGGVPGGAAGAALRGEAANPGFPAGGGRGGGPGFGGATGLERMFSEGFGAQISWLLPAALVLLAGGLWATRRAARTDLARAGLLLWGGWLVTTGVVFSYMEGTIHEYYTVALAPSVGGTVATGSAVLWRTRDELASRIALAAAFAVSGVWAYELLGRVSWQGWLRVPVLIAGLGAAALMLFYVLRPETGPGGALDVAETAAARRRTRYASAGVVALAGIGMLAGPTAYALDTVTTPHTGATPLAGPGNRGGGFPGGGGFTRRAGQAQQFAARGNNGPGGFGLPDGGALPGGGQLPRLGQGAGPGQLPGGGQQAPGSGQGPGNGQGPGFEQRPGGGPLAGGAGGFGGGVSTENGAVLALLTTDAEKFRWAAAVANSQAAASIELATGGTPVMAMGGFTGSDPAITLARFQRYVAQGDIHYFVGGGRAFGGPGRNATSEISSWVQDTFTSVTVGGETLYDLTKPAARGGAT